MVGELVGVEPDDGGALWLDRGSVVAGIAGLEGGGSTGIGIGTSTGIGTGTSTGKGLSGACVMIGVGITVGTSVGVGVAAACVAIGVDCDAAGATAAAWIWSGASEVFARRVVGCRVVAG